MDVPKAFEVPYFEPNMGVVRHSYDSSWAASYGSSMVPLGIGEQLSCVVTPHGSYDCTEVRHGVSMRLGRLHELSKWRSSYSLPALVENNAALLSHGGNPFCRLC